MFPKCLAAAVLLAAFVISAAGQHQPNRPASKRPVSGSSELRVDRVELSTTRIVLPCPPGVRSRSDGCNDSMLVTAKAKVSGARLAAVNFQHLVTGGRIVRQSNGTFEWDLSGIPPGRYTLILTASDKRGRQSAPVSVEVELVSCPDCGGDSCPVITVTGPSSETPAGDLMEFSALATGISKDTQFNWTVSAGTIESGQGTTAIKVRTDREQQGMTITATLEIGNDNNFGPMCETTTSATGATAIQSPLQRSL